jgi:hypothetical protein
MDAITRAQARQDLVALALPQIVLDVFDGKVLPYNLDIYFGEPGAMFSLGAEAQAGYGQGRITPLWTDCDTVVAYRQIPPGYFWFDIETPWGEELPVGLSWQQVLVKEFKCLWEAQWPDERLREVAGWFGFEHIDLLIAELQQADLDTFEKDDVWYQSFLKRIAG